MPVCLHCGELGPEGSLFCTKCGYTLPQPGASSVTPSIAPTVLPTPAAAPRPGPSPASPYAQAPVAPSPYGAAMYSPYGAPPAYAIRASAVPGSTAPINPPPGGKFCVHCRTVISVAAVYCPVCQRPQP